MALYRRYRPQKFQDVIGQEHVTRPLMAALRADRTAHAYLFSGPRGCGKTTSARILARCLNCEQAPTDTPCGQCESCRELSLNGGGSLDVVEMDAASHGGVDDARELIERAAFAPARDRYKIFVIDEAHMVSNQGFNALLKLVEEPPPHVKFVFATTEPEKVIGTIRSRTHHYPFRLVPPETLESYMSGICAEEGIEIGAGVLPLVVRAGGGSVRDSLSVLDQLMGGSEGDVLAYEQAIALLGFTDGSLLDDAAEAIAARDGATLFAVVERVVQSGHDPRRFVEDLLQRLRDLVVISLAGEQAGDVLTSVPRDQYERMLAQAEHLGARGASRAADLTNEALSGMVGATSPRLLLELLCARLLLPQAPGGAEPASDRAGQGGDFAAGNGGVGGGDGGVRGDGSLGTTARNAVRPPAQRPASAQRPAAARQSGGPGVPGGPEGPSAPAGSGTGFFKTASRRTTGQGVSAGDPGMPDHAWQSADADMPASSNMPAGQEVSGAPGEPSSGEAPASDAGRGAEPHSGRPAASRSQWPAPADGPWPAAGPDSAARSGAPSGPVPSAGADRAGGPAPAARQAPAGGHAPAVGANRSAGPDYGSGGQASQARAARPPQGNRPEPAARSAQEGRPAREDRSAPNSGQPRMPEAAPGPAGDRRDQASRGTVEAAVGSGDASIVRQRWKEIVEAVARTSKSSAALIDGHAMIGSLQDGMLILQFKTAGLATTFNDRGHGERVGAALHDVLGIDVRVRALVGGGDGPKAPPAHSRAGSPPGAGGVPSGGRSTPPVTGGSAQGGRGAPQGAGDAPFGVSGAPSGAGGATSAGSLPAGGNRQQGSNPREEPAGGAHQDAPDREPSAPAPGFAERADANVLGGRGANRPSAAAPLHDGLAEAAPRQQTGHAEEENAYAGTAAEPRQPQSAEPDHTAGGAPAVAGDQSDVLADGAHAVLDIAGVDPAGVLAQLLDAPKAHPAPTQPQSAGTPKDDRAPKDNGAPRDEAPPVAAEGEASSGPGATTQPPAGRPERPAPPSPDRGSWSWSTQGGSAPGARSPSGKGTQSGTGQNARDATPHEGQSSAPAAGSSGAADTPPGAAAPRPEAGPPFYPDDLPPVPEYEFFEPDPYEPGPAAAGMPPDAAPRPAPVPGGRTASPGRSSAPGGSLSSSGASSPEPSHETPHNTQYRGGGQEPGRTNGRGSAGEGRAPGRDGSGSRDRAQERADIQNRDDVPFYKQRMPMPAPASSDSPPEFGPDSASPRSGSPGAAPTAWRSDTSSAASRGTTSSQGPASPQGRDAAAWQSPTSQAPGDATSEHGAPPQFGSAPQHGTPPQYGAASPYGAPPRSTPPQSTVPPPAAPSQPGAPSRRGGRESIASKILAAHGGDVDHRKRPSLAESQAELARARADEDEVSRFDPTVEQSNLVGLDVVLSTFDATIIEEIAKNEGGQ